MWFAWKLMPLITKNPAFCAINFVNVAILQKYIEKHNLFRFNGTPLLEWHIPSADLVVSFCKLDKSLYFPQATILIFKP